MASFLLQISCKHIPVLTGGEIDEHTHEQKNDRAFNQLQPSGSQILAGPDFLCIIDLDNRQALSGLGLPYWILGTDNNTQYP
jgi:hypothetical protein